MCPHAHCNCFSDCVNISFPHAPQAYVAASQIDSQLTDGALDGLSSSAPCGSYLSVHLSTLRHPLFSYACTAAWGGMALPALCCPLRLVLLEATLRSAAAGVAGLQPLLPQGG